MTPDDENACVEHDRDFVRIDREYPRLPEVLLTEAPRFADSDEYRALEPDDHNLPSIVVARFGNYVERLFHASPGPSADDTERSAAIRAIERLASSPDPDVQNALTIDVFHGLDLPPDTLERFILSLGPSARRLYDQWPRP